MLKPLLVVIAVGTAIGLMVPAPESPASAPVAAVGATGTQSPRPSGSPLTLRRQTNGHFYVHASVDGQVARFLIDTGASSVALTERDAERLGVKFSRDMYEVVGMGASGPVRGQEVMFDKVSVDDREVTQVRGMVLEGLEISLLGHSYLSRVGSIEMNGDTMVIN